MSMEVYERGPVRLVLADCLEWLPTLEAGSVDCVVTDPPYEITAAGGGIVRSRRDLQLTEGFTDCGFDYRILAQFDCWMCFGTLRQVPKLIQAAEQRRWMLITWNKSNPCPLVNGNYLPDTEYVIHAWKSGKLFGEFSDRTRFIVHPLGDKEQGEHPNEKPAKVMIKLVRLAAPAGGLILDPFTGSGTTAIACIRTGRRFVGAEIEKKYFDIACARIDRELNQLKLFDKPEPVIETQKTLL